MTAIFNGRLAAAAAFAALVGVGASSAAHASVEFTNITSQAIHFTMSCDGTVGDPWRIDPHASGALSCNNGSQAAVVVIRTDDGNGGGAVVRATVWDGRRYTIGYDHAGDVSIAND